MKKILRKVTLTLGISLLSFSNIAWADNFSIQNTTLEIKAKDNTALFTQAWQNTENTKAIVIIMHGLKDHSSRYSYFAENLVKNRFSVYAFDLRGHGKSGGKKVFVNSFDEYLNDLESFVSYVKEKEPNKPIFIFGHSMGGAITTLFTMKKNPAIKGIILSAPALKAGSSVSPLLINITNFLANIAPETAVLELEDKFFSRDPEVLKAMKEDTLISHENGPAKTASELLKALSEIEARMKSFNYPMLLLHGTKDVITNIEGSKKFYKVALSENKKLRLYNGLYHDLLHEPEKEEVIADIVMWLNANYK